ncbi:MAG: hypothetical protein ACREVX_04590 [Clostridium sp.]|uniref:hypothetical protein n=1 Tax=Clostridium sp. TaxID=1506 RepID=UPI003D6DA1DC
MKTNLKMKNFILIISILAILKGFFLSGVVNKNKDNKGRYGVYLVFAERVNKIH